MKVHLGVFVAIGSALLAGGGHALAKEAELTRQECAGKAQIAASQLRDMASAIEAEATYAEAHGGAFSPELTQEFVQWYRREGAKAGSDLPDLGRTDLTREEEGRRQAAVDRFQRERNDRHKARATTIQREAARGCPALAPVRSSD